MKPEYSEKYSQKTQKFGEKKEIKKSVKARNKDVSNSPAHSLCVLVVCQRIFNPFI